MVLKRKKENRIKGILKEVKKIEGYIDSQMKKFNKHVKSLSKTSDIFYSLESELQDLKIKVYKKVKETCNTYKKKFK